jgi:hypothetical protein
VPAACRVDLAYRVVDHVKFWNPHPGDSAAEVHTIDMYKYMYMYLSRSSSNLKLFNPRNFVTSLAQATLFCGQSGYLLS